MPNTEQQVEPEVPRRQNDATPPPDNTPADTAVAQKSLEETYNYLRGDDSTDQFKQMLTNARSFAMRSNLDADSPPRPGEIFVGGHSLNGPYRIHELKIDGAKPTPFAEKSGRVGDTKPGPVPANVVADKDGSAKEVKYPQGDRAVLGKKGNDYNEVVFYDKDGKEASHYVKRGDDWYSQTRDGMKAKLEGRIEVSPNGNVSMEIEPNTWKTRKNDGTVQIARDNQDGSRVGYSEQGQPNRITRPDKTAVEGDYTNGELSTVREFDKDGQLTKTWTKKGDQFESNPASSETRKNMELTSKGIYNYESSDGFKYSITGDNAKVIDDLGHNIKRDAQGHTASIAYPGGDKTRTFGRDADGNVNKIVTKDTDGKVTLERQGNQWTMRMGSMPPIPYPGDVKVSANNDVSFETKKGVWHTEKSNGTILTEKANPGGSRVSVNKDGQTDQITRADGSVVEGRHKDGKLYQVTEFGADGKKTTWVDKGDKWEASPSTGETRKDMQMFKTGLTLWEAQDGTKHGFMGDGKSLRERPGEAKYSFDKKGEIESIAYPDGEKLKFSRFESGQIREIQQFKNEKLAKTQTRDSENSTKWSVKGADGKESGTWNGKHEVTASGVVRHKEQGDRNKDGYWTVIKPDGSQFKEQVSADGSRKMVRPDKSFAEIDKDGIVRTVGKSKDNYRALHYENGELSKVTEYRKGKEPSSWTPPTGAKVTEDGDITYRTENGRAVIDKTNLSKVEIDSDGSLLKVTQADKSSREFGYKLVGDKKELDSITDSRINEKGEVKTEKWQREYNQSNGFPTDKFVKPGTSGSEPQVRTDVNVLRDGDYEYKGGDGKTRLARAGRDANGSMSESVSEAHDKLLEATEGHMDAPRKQRLEAFMKQFEKRAQTRIEDQVAAGEDRTKVEESWQKKVAGTYDHLAAMTKSDLPNAPYDMETRIKLVENSMLFAMEPTKNNQGGHGTCWIEGPINLIGWTNNPDKMARLVSQVSTTGTFTTIEGPNNGGGAKTYTIPKSQLDFDREAKGWTVDGSDKVLWNRNGYGNIPRSPVGQICDHTLSYIGGRSDGGTNGGTWESFRTTGNRWYYGSQELMRMATGDTAKLVRIQSNQITNSDIQRLTSGDLKEEMLKRGGVVLVGPGHIFTAKMVHLNGERSIVSDNQWGPDSDQKIGVIKDVASWNVQRTREKYSPVWPTGIPRIDDDNKPSPNRPRNRQLPTYYDSVNQPVQPQPYPYYPQPQPIYYPQPQNWHQPNRPGFIRRWRNR